MAGAAPRRLADAGRREISEEQACAAFDRAARHYLGMSGEEFLAAWGRGAFGPDPGRRPGVMEVAVMRAWVR